MSKRDLIALLALVVLPFIVSHVQSDGVCVNSWLPRIGKHRHDTESLLSHSSFSCQLFLSLSRASIAGFLISFHLERKKERKQEKPEHDKPFT